MARQGPQMLKVYAYKGCSTCREALKWLNARGIPFEEVAIRETPPYLEELESMLATRPGGLRSLFNTSGLDYRAMNLKDRLPQMDEAAAIQLLAENGNLIKRPFAIDTAAGVFLTGFKEAEWQAALG